MANFTISEQIRSSRVSSWYYYLLISWESQLLLFFNWRSLFANARHGITTILEKTSPSSFVCNFPRWVSGEISIFLLFEYPCKWKVSHDLLYRDKFTRSSVFFNAFSPFNFSFLSIFYKLEIRCNASENYYKIIYYKFHGLYYVKQNYLIVSLDLACAILVFIELYSL